TRLLETLRITQAALELRAQERETDRGEHPAQEAPQEQRAALRPHLLELERGRLEHAQVGLRARVDRLEPLQDRETPEQLRVVQFLRVAGRGQVLARHRGRQELLLALAPARALGLHARLEQAQLDQQRFVLDLG